MSWMNLFEDLDETLDTAAERKKPEEFLEL